MVGLCFSASLMEMEICMGSGSLLLCFVGGDGDLHGFSFCVSMEIERGEKKISIGQISAILMVMFSPSGDGAATKDDDGDEERGWRCPNEEMEMEMESKTLHSNWRDGEATLHRGWSGERWKIWRR
ncbi:hypothetical protein MRB53_014190 [Persea americana]|uniref:Uncharacterized protein n=1 Tax=Persea americana TaxID=3435 RepID=A0ACC2KA66_PERAE|nr:hypothetical protein MRB53_014190 [Persea americana]